MALNLDILPRYHFSSFRTFMPCERHITRYCKDDVLVMVYAGVLRFTEAGEEIEVHSGEFYLQKHGLFQEGATESDCPQYYYVHFSGDFSPGTHTFPLSGKADFSPLFPLFRQLDQLQQQNASQLEQNAVFYQILSRLNAPVAMTDARKIINKIVSMVFSDLEKNWSLKDFSNTCGYCENQIIKIFRGETGMTPHAYLTRLKMNMAKQFLSTTSLPVQQISQDCGFGSYVNFYKEFVRSEGCSPTFWRNKQLFPDNPYAGMR